nr:NADH dehydrogenase subunit 4l [Physella acuta]
MLIFITSVFVLTNYTSYMYFIVILELLSLEILFITFYFSGLVFSLSDFLIMLTLVTSEAALGLSLMITTLRVNGNDMVNINIAMV